MKRIKQALLSLLLCLALCLSLLPAAVFAEDADPAEIAPAAQMPSDTSAAQETDGAQPDEDAPAPADLPGEGITADEENAAADAEIASADALTDSNGDSTSPAGTSDVDENPLRDEETETPPEIPETDETPEAELVRVLFVCEPAETRITVFAALGADGEEEAPALEAQEDSSYLLPAGDYRYDAFCEEYEPLRDVPFTAEGGEVVLTVTLTSVQETQPAEEETVIHGESEVELFFLEDDGADADSLFAAYAQRILQPRPMLFASNAAGRNLTGSPRAAYDCIKPLILQVAAGELGSARFSVPVSSLAMSKTLWMSAEFPSGTLLDASGNLTSEASAEIRASLGNQLQVRATVSALLNDCPYELYWFDKSSTGGFGISYSYNILSANAVEVTSITYVFCVSADYSVTGGYRTFDVDPSAALSVRTARQNAETIVSRYAGLTDRDKLISYGTEICNLVSYNYDALSSSTAYGNPWQLIWVFDGDSSTNVVCEGYAKAFQYLCDLSRFSSSQIRSILAEGTMSQDGLTPGAHMWNVVRLDDGNNYLVDVTSSDGINAVPGELFLAGCYSGSVQEGYAFHAFGSVFTYRYNDESLSTFSESDLTIASGRVVVDSGTFGGGNLFWTLYDDGEMVLSGTGSSENYYQTTPPWADHNDDILSLTVESTVSSIGACAFPYCENLRQVSITGATTIGDCAFTGCSALDTLLLPATLQHVCQRAFSGCDSLAMVFYEGTVSERSGIRFDYDNDPLETATWLYYGDLTGVLATGYCGDPIRSVAWSLDSEGLLALSGSGNMMSMPSSTDYPWVLLWPSISAVTLSEGITSVGDYAFAGLSMLSSVSLPGSITSVGIGAFAGDSRLHSVGGADSGCDVTYGWTDAIPAGAFTSLANLSSAVVADGITAIGDSAFAGCGALSSLTLPEGLTSIGSSAFASCSQLSSVTLPDTLTSLGTSCFERCAALETVVIGQGVTTLPRNLFFDCGALESVTIPVSITTVDYNAFGLCPDPTTVYYGGNEEAWNQIQIRSGNTSILHDVRFTYTAVASGVCGAQGDNLTWTLYENGDLVIAGQGEMQDYDYNGSSSAPWFGTEAGAALPTVQTLLVQSGVTSIGDYALAGCHALRHVTLPGSLESIGWQSFSGCSSLSSLTLPEGLVSISDAAFFATALTEISFPASLRSLETGSGDSLFGSAMQNIRVAEDNPVFCSVDGVLFSRDRKALVLFPSGRTGSYTVPDGTERIASEAFNCSLLSEVILPEGVTVIERYAFWFNYHLNHITLPESLHTISMGAFGFRFLDPDALPPEVYYAGTELEAAALKDSGDWSTRENTLLFGDDAVWHYREDPTASYVKRCYSLIQNREGDLGGVAFWADLLRTRQATGASIVAAFMDSDEFKGRGLSNEEVLSILYNTMMNRQPDEGGWNYYLGLLDKGVSYNYIVNSFAYSAEFKGICDSYGIATGSVGLSENRDKNPDVTAFVSRCYQIVLGRAAEVEGLNYWTGALLNKTQTGAQLVDSFITSDEFKGRGLSDEAGIEVVYQTMLNRASDEGGRNYWLEALDAGVSLRCIVNQFAYSQEFAELCGGYGINPGSIRLSEARDQNINVTKFVDRCFRYALERKGDESGLNYWASMINSKLRTPAQVARSYVFSDECVNRNLSDAEFIAMLYRLYMGREADEAGLGYWVQQLQSGAATRQQAADGFAGSQEFRDIVAGYGL